MHIVLADDTAKGPYSTLIQAGDFVYLSGQGGIDPATDAIVEGGIKAETKQTFANIEALLKRAGLGLENLVQMTCFLADIDELGAMNEAYAEACGPGVSPVRTSVAVAALPFGLRVEMSAVAYRG